MTHEQQIAAGREIARANEEWAWDETIGEITHPCGAAVAYRWGFRDWAAWHPHRVVPVAVRATAAAAIRALGFTIHVREE